MFGSVLFLVHMDFSVLKAIFDSMEQGVLFLDGQNLIVYCNPAAERIRNVSLDEIFGRSILECHPSKSRPKVLRLSMT